MFGPDKTFSYHEIWFPHIPMDICHKEFLERALTVSYIKVAVIVFHVYVCNEQRYKDVGGVV